MIDIYKRSVISTIFILILTSLFPILPESSFAEEMEPKALIIYTAKEEEVGENQRALDMLLGHFTPDVKVISSKDVTKNDLKGVTHLFYYGMTAGTLPDGFETIFDEYVGAFIAIGYNSEKLGDHFAFIDPQHERGIDELWITNDKTQSLKDNPQEIIDVKAADDAKVLIEGKNKEESDSYPVMLKKDDHYFYAVDTVLSNEAVLFGEILHEVFDVTHAEEHPGYIRLEDVHPLVDPSNVEEIAAVLKEKDIPYMIAVIPVYTDPKTGEEYHFSDSPKLLKVLKKMQKDGASILLHGYTHQFRQSETGEGFEFWDVEKNTPIYAPADDKFKLKEESAFNSKSAFKAYMKELKAHETAYIEEKLTKGIQELVNYGLYPLAFEAPHYTMSQNGYQIAAEYFSTYSGQLQLSDEDWLIMESTPYITKPSFLGDMELLPETIGYVHPQNNDSIPEMMDNAKKMSQTKDSMIAGFYHPYLGVEGLKELLAEMERQPHLKWMDLKEREVWVKADNVHLYTEDGVVQVDVKKGKMAFSSLDFFSYHYFKWSNGLAWSMSMIGAAAVLVFILLTFINYRRKSLK